MAKKTKKLLIAVLMGGPSAEHEISLASGKEVLKNLDKKKYFVRPVVISKKGEWLTRGRRVGIRAALRGVDAVVDAMHGEYGEDGTIQNILYRCRVPCTGSDAAASRLGMDKFGSRAIFKKHGLFTPRTFKLERREYQGAGKELLEDISRSIGAMPWVVKPCRRGSSVGVSIAKTPVFFRKAAGHAFAFDDIALIEERIVGTEITIPILEIRRGTPEALPLIEIRPKAGTFFDYEQKYNESGAEEIVPAQISIALSRKAKKAGLLAHRLLGLRSYSRIDCILKNGRPYILEANTLPGLTSASLFPKAAAKAGIAFPRLLDILIANAL